MGIKKPKWIWNLFNLYISILWDICCVYVCVFLVSMQSLIYFMCNHVMLCLFMVFEISILKFAISDWEKLNCSPLAIFKANMQQNAPQSYPFFCCGVFSLLPSNFHSSMSGSVSPLLSSFHASLTNWNKMFSLSLPSYLFESKYFIFLSWKNIVPVAQWVFPRLIGKINLSFLNKSFFIQLLKF